MEETEEIERSKQQNGSKSKGKTFNTEEPRKRRKLERKAEEKARAAANQPEEMPEATD